MNFPDAIAAVSAFSGQAVPQQDAQGNYRFDIHPRPVALRLHPDGGTFSLRSVVGRLADASFELQAGRLLEANLAGEPSAFSLEANGVAYLTQAFRLDRLDAAQFEAALQAFVRRTVRWSRCLETPASARELS